MHLYIDLAIVDVSEQTAQEAVAVGRWEECFNSHELPEQYLPPNVQEIVHVYHKSHKKGTL
jgi:hypothetical protein